MQPIGKKISLASARPESVIILPDDTTGYALGTSKYFSLGYHWERVMMDPLTMDAHREFLGLGQRDNVADTNQR